MHEAIICTFYSRPRLPSTIEATVAVQTFRSQRGLVLNLFRHCLISLADTLYAESIISQEVYDIAYNEYIGKNQRCAALLDCVEARVGLVPLDFNKVLHILQCQPFLESLADRLILTYCEWIPFSGSKGKIIMVSCSCLLLCPWVFDTKPYHFVCYQI